jgi:exopolysaccharide production protein ExoQ
MIEVLVGAACYLTFFALVPGVGAAMQAGALGLLLAAAAYAVLLEKVRPLPLSATESVMYVVGVLYVILGMFQELDAMLPSVAFLTTVIMLSIISRTITLDRFLDVGAGVALLCVLTSIAVDHTGVIAALSASVGRGGLDRFTPLGTTPNLVGYTFGAGAILMARRAIVSKWILERMMMAAAAMLSCTFVLAASARASLVALIVAIILSVILEIRIGRLLRMLWVRIAGVTCVLVAVVFNDKITGYFDRMLELDSNTRGLASGGTGRTQLWARGIAAVFSDPMTFTFGGGFRSSNSDLIGFSTENSYISILLDSGIFAGAAIILVFCYAPIKALKLVSPQERYTSSLVLLASFFTFLVVESFFNRYLLAIGNPISLISLTLLFSLSMRQKLNGNSPSPK